MFKSNKPTIKVIEVSPSPLPSSFGEESRTMVEGLASNPGFLYLVNKLRLERAVLEDALKKTRHESLREVDFLQSGLYWLGWLEAKVETETKLALRRTQAHKASTADLDSMLKTMESIQLIGSPE